MDSYHQAEFPDNTSFLIVDKLIHGCLSKESKQKLMAKRKNVSVKDCLELTRRCEVLEATMKKFEDSNDAHVDASHTGDPTQKLQRNGSKKKQFNPSFKPKSVGKESDDKKSDGKKSCIWCKEDIYSHDKCPAKDATCKFCSKQGHFEWACLKKKRTYKDKKSKHHHAVDIESDQESSEYDDDFDLRAVSIHSVNNRESREVLAPLVFHPKDESSQSSEITGKVDTSAMVSYNCQPPCFHRSGSPRGT